MPGPTAVSAKAEALIAAEPCLTDSPASVVAASDVVFTTTGNPSDVCVIVCCALTANRPQEGPQRELCSDHNGGHERDDGGWHVRC